MTEGWRRGGIEDWTLPLFGGVGGEGLFGRSQDREEKIQSKKKSIKRRPGRFYKIKYLFFFSPFPPRFVDPKDGL